MTVGLASRAQIPGADLRAFGKLVRYYDARFPLGIGGGLPADNTAMQTLKDLSGNGGDLTMATAVNRPLWRAGGKNICPAFDKWTLYGGATFDTNTGVLTLPQGSNVVAEVFIYVGGAANGTFSAEFNAGAQSSNTPYQPNGGRLMNSAYFAEDKTTLVQNTAGSTTNGNAQPVPVGSYSNRLVATNAGLWTNTLGPNVKWLRLRIQNDNTYGSSSPLLVRMPQYDLSSSTPTEFVPQSRLPLFCSTEQNQRWFTQSGNSGLPRGAYTAYMVSAFGNFNGSSRWVYGTRIGSSGSTTDRSMILQSGQTMYTYAPTQTAALAKSGLVPIPRPGRLLVTSHIWYDDAQNLGLGFNGLPFDKSTPTGWAAGRQTYGDFTGPLCFLGYSTSSSIAGGIAIVAHYSGVHDTFTRKRIERLLGGLAGMTVPMAA